MGRQLHSAIFSVFFIGIVLFIGSQVVKMVFTDPPGVLPDPVRGKAFVALKETAEATRTPKETGTGKYNLYYITGKYEDNGVTETGKYEVPEDVYYKAKEGDQIDIYYYPGTGISDYGDLPTRSAFAGGGDNSFRSMQKLIGVFILGVVALMAFNVVRRLLLPAFTGQSSMNVRFRPINPKPIDSPKNEYNPFNKDDPRL